MLIVFISLISVIIFSFFKKHRQIFFWLSLFIISLTPTLTPFGISGVVNERYVYLGSIGIFVTVSLFFTKLINIKRVKAFTYILFFLIILSLMTRTIVRNIDWKNQDNLWLAAKTTSPSSAQNHNNLGDYYGRQGDLESAVQEFKTAIKLKPNYAEAHHNLANTYQRLKKIDPAIKNYQKALEFKPNLWQSHQNLASIFYQQEKNDLAKKHLLKAIKINPNNPSLYKNLAAVYQKLNDQKSSQIYLQKAKELESNNP